MDTFNVNDVESEVEKGIGIQSQLRIWDSLLEIRIQLQKLLVESNELPQLDLFDSVTKAASNNAANSVEFMSAVQNSRTAIKTLMENLLGLQSLLSPASISNTEKDDLEESITSEDESQDELSKKSIEPDNCNDDDNDEDDEDDSDVDMNTSFGNGSQKSVSKEKESIDDLSSDDGFEEEDGEPVKRKKLRLNDFEHIVSKNFKASVSRRNAVIQKWNDKTQIASGKVNKNNFSAFQISTVKQIDHVLANKERLLKRTQIRNSQIDGSKNEEAEKPEDALDPEYFNDDDFFHQLLRELIENSASNSNKSSDLTHHYLKLQKLRTKFKRKVDTKASKGRKIRYDVHTKLVNFMAPYEDKNSMTENAKTELYKSIFKNLFDWKNETE